MTPISIIQTLAFYLIVIAFILFGAWKVWERFFKKDKRENVVEEKIYLYPEGSIRKIETKKFKSLDELKGGFRFK